jgi:hypothetical protein
MPAHSTFDILAEMGVTPVCTLTDEQMFRLLTPMVLQELGEFLPNNHELTLQETTQGLFQGDEITNLNRHRIFGKLGNVRFPPLVSWYRTRHGMVRIKRDFMKISLAAWHGDPDRKVELLFLASLRDRRFDGTARADDCALSRFNCHDPMAGVPLAFEGITARSVELSIYSFRPGCSCCQRDTYRKFMENPYRFVSRPLSFFRHFWRAWESGCAPGQWTTPFRDVSTHVLPVLEELALEKEYDFIESCPSHMHVARWFMRNHYRFENPAHLQEIEELWTGVKNLELDLHKLTGAQRSWVCVLQSLPEESIPSKFRLRGPKWRQDNIGLTNYWMCKPLSQRASQWLEAHRPHHDYG